MSSGTASRTCVVKPAGNIEWSGTKVECTGMQTRHITTTTNFICMAIKES